MTLDPGLNEDDFNNPLETSSDLHAAWVTHMGKTNG